MHLAFDGNSFSTADGRWKIDGGWGIHLVYKEEKIARSVLRLRPDNTVTGLSFTPDSRWLTVTGGNVMTVWPLRPVDMIATACARLRHPI
jgi:hypothetical protein